MSQFRYLYSTIYRILERIRIHTFNFLRKSKGITFIYTLYSMKETKSHNLPAKNVLPRNATKFRPW